MIKHHQYYEDLGRVKDRLEDSLPKTERRIDFDLTGTRGVKWQCKQNLQSNQCNSIPVNRDLAKIVSLPSISQSALSHQNKESSRNQPLRLSTIAEENSTLTIIEKAKSGRSVSTNLSRTSASHSTIAGKRSSMNRSDCHNEHFNWFRKYSFPHIIAKTSDDRFYLKQHAYVINQRKRLVEQKLQQFLYEIKPLN